MSATPTLRKRPTQDDVARAAGVSQTVVSLVLNDRAPVSISPETRQRVLDAIDELGYVPDGSARSLRTQKDPHRRQPDPRHHQPLLPRLRARHPGRRRRRGYDLIAYNTDGLREKELRCLRSVQRARVDGIIATPFQLTADDFSPCSTSGVPVVVFGELAEAPASPPFDSVFVDDFAAAAELVGYLLEPRVPAARHDRRLRRHLRRRGASPAISRLLAERAPPQDEMLARGGDADRGRRLRRDAGAAGRLAAAARRSSPRTT